MATPVNPQLRYSEEELKEFEIIISEKLANSKRELAYIRDSLSRKNDQGTDLTGSGYLSLEDGAETAEKEHLNQLASRLQKFTAQLETAMIRIKNGTYGVCIDTGRLIPKERLRAVPHTQHSIEAKMAK
jgi:RNA polymerase-binding transcription factor DksA